MKWFARKVYAQSVGLKMFQRWENFHLAGNLIQDELD